MTKSTHAAAAQMIRKELKAAFPGVKFSVRSASASMTDSVGISWTDGPTRDQVKNITDKFKQGHFDSMEDIYEYSNKRGDLPQTQFVNIERSMSEDTKAALSAFATEHFETSDWDEYQAAIEARYIFADCDFTSNADANAVIDAACQKQMV